MPNATQSTANDTASNFIYFQNALEKIDPVLHQPLSNFTWGRDIDLRGGISLADEIVSYETVKYSSRGTDKKDGLPYITADTTEFTGVSLEGEKKQSTLRNLGKEIVYTKLELQKAAARSFPLLQQKVNALQLYYQSTINDRVYKGDGDNKGLTTLETATKLTSSTAFDSLDADGWVTEINNLLEKIWSACGETIAPNHVLLPADVWAKLASTKYSSDANKTLLQYLEQSCISSTANGSKTNFYPCSYCNAKNLSGNKGKIIAYTKNANYIRFAMAPLQKQEPFTDGWFFKQKYVWSLGGIELIYPETFGTLTSK